MMKRIKGRTISKGDTRGQVLLSKEPITFLGGVDPETGIVMEKGHPLEGQCVTGRILVFPKGKGSTVGTYVLYQMKKNGMAPAGIINTQSEQMVVTGAIISDIPMMDTLDEDPLEILKDGMEIRINSTEGYIEVMD